MNNIQEALQRQLGPFPAWGWAIILFAVLYFYRFKLGGLSGGTSTATSPIVVPEGSSVYDPRIIQTAWGDAPIGMYTPQDPAAATQQVQPQTPITLQPGETVYDPNTGNLLNTPGALLTTGTAANQVAQQGGTSPNLSAAQTSLALTSGGLVTAAALPTATNVSP